MRFVEADSTVCKEMPQHTCMFMMKIANLRYILKTRNICVCIRHTFVIFLKMCLWILLDLYRTRNIVLLKNVFVEKVINM